MSRVSILLVADFVNCSQRDKKAEPKCQYLIELADFLLNVLDNKTLTYKLYIANTGEQLTTFIQGIKLYKYAYKLNKLLISKGINCVIEVDLLDNLFSNFKHKQFYKSVLHTYSELFDLANKMENSTVEGNFTYAAEPKIANKWLTTKQGGKSKKKRKSKKKSNKKSIK
jgi:hypothetical protein